MNSPPQPDPAAIALLAAYQQQTQSIRLKVQQYISALWLSLGEYRAPQMAQFAGQVLPVVAGAQQHVSALTVAMLTEQRRVHQGRVKVPAVNPKSVTGSALRNGVPMGEVYGRPFHLVWRELGAAQTKRDAHYQWTPTPAAMIRPALPPADYVDKAIKSGLARAINLAHTDLQLAKTHTAQQIIQAAEVSGYRRVLEGSSSCGKCIVASTQLYHRGKLMPIHPGCDCGIAEVFEGSDLAQFTNDQYATLPAAHAAIEAAFGKSAAGARFIPGQGDLQYKDVLIEHTDGEIGPILAVRGQHFTGPTQLAA